MSCFPCQGAECGYGSATSVFFSLPGYAPDAAARADGLGMPLFVLDRAGTPRPVNSPADELLSTGA
ncbi:hypothetical protein ACH4CE_10370 [Streptomyces gelaticus]|uniref:hypothetical protein n=1 Tax=Streptomyces gelaticus TaxID=285446 RepID=UPI00379E4FBB